MDFKLRMRFLLPSRRRCVVVLSGLLLGSGTQTSRGQALEGLKKSYEEEISKAVLPLREGYRKALLTLEQSFAAKGAYVEARRVQEERRSVERIMGRSMVPPDATGGDTPAGGQLKLTPGGEGSGGLKHESGAWIGWQTEGAALRWNLPPGIKGGGYSLELVYRSTGAGILPLTLREDFHGLNRSVKVEAAMDAEKRVQLGVLRLRPGAAFLELKLSGPGTAVDFRLLEVLLTAEGGPA